MGWQGTTAVEGSVADVERTWQRLRHRKVVQWALAYAAGSLALAALREAQKAGCRAWWRYYRDFDPALASIRNEPDFKAVFADIERDIAQQRAELAKNSKNAPLALEATGT